ncbi:MAG: aminotransferase class V-fold PLP-dependent enzyme [Chitinophagaceae bacterium]|nr:MAG: aminotransferase class V-fold PLP-dependent enzyme [Chitinophagaceae bacterium]
MQSLIQSIQAQEHISNQLEIATDKRKDITNSIVALAHQYIDDLPKLKTFINKEVQQGKIKINSDTKSIDEILSIFHSEVTETGIRAASGGHLGYIPGGGIYAGALGDYLAAISNAYAGVSYASPGAAAIENEVVNWLKQIFNFPANAVGTLTSGGSIANLTALTSARDHYQIKNEKIVNSVIYLTDHVHHCIQKSLRIIGLEDVIIRKIKLDEKFRMDVHHLEEQIKNDVSKHLNPFLVIASAGTTDVGAVDPLDHIADIAHQNNLWFHVDAAYGGFFILSSKKALLKGIEKADSLVVDPHKGLFIPYGLGAVLVKDSRALLHSNLYTANYMQDALTDDLTMNPANVSPELTRHFRAMRLWLPLQLHGVAPFAACLEEKLLLTQYIRIQLAELGFSLSPDPDLSVSYFWYPFKENINEWNKKLLQYIHEDGSAYFSSTLINDLFVIRIAILSFRTKLAIINQAVAMIERCLNKIKTELNHK